MSGSCVFKFVFGCIVVLTIIVKIDAYTVCGDPTYKAVEEQAAVNDIVSKLMKLRSSDWLWGSISTITALQVSAPKKFFGRDKTIKALKGAVNKYWNFLEPIDIAELAFVARSLCLDPRRLEGRDLLNKIHDSMADFLKNETEALEEDHIVDFALLLSSLCINSFPIDARLVEGLLNRQMSDGSFGSKLHAADATITMLRPVYCLSRMENVQFNTTLVFNAVLKMRDFIVKQVNKPHPRRSEIFIGPDAITTTNAIVGLYKTMQPGEDPNKKWRCREVMNYLGLKPSETDDEHDLQERLLHTTASDYLDLQTSKYKCLDSKELDLIPLGYQPKCDYEKPETCGIGLPDTPK